MPEDFSASIGTYSIGHRVVIEIVVAHIASFKVSYQNRQDISGVCNYGENDLQELFLFFLNVLCPPLHPTKIT